MRLFLVEAVARVAKNELNLLMREKTKEVKAPLEVIIIIIIIITIIF